MNQIDIHYIEIKICRLTGDGENVILPQTLKQGTYVFVDKERFKRFLKGFEPFFLEKYWGIEQGNED